MPPPIELLFHVYPDGQMRWRWRAYRVGAGMKVVAISSDGYKTQEECLEVVEFLRHSGPQSAVFPQEEAAPSE